MGVVSWIGRLGQRKPKIVDNNRLLPEGVSVVDVQGLSVGLREDIIKLVSSHSSGISVKEASSIAKLCVHKVAQSGSSVQWILKKVSNGQEVVVKDSKSRAFSIVNNPNPSQSRSTFIYTCLQQIQRHGRCFITVWRDLEGNAVDLVVADYNQVKVEFDERAGIFYTVTWPDPYGVQYYLEGDMVDWIRPSVDDVGKEEGSWQIAEEELLGDGLARDWQQISMRNRVLPDAVVELPDGSSDEQVEQVSVAINNRSGAENARRILVITGEVGFKPLAMPAAEADFIETRKFYREQIAAMFGVPPTVLGFMENATLANMDASKIMMWEDTVIPLMTQLGEELCRFLNQELSDTYILVPDTSNIEALKHRVESRAGAAESLQRMGVPFDLINNRLGLGVDVFDGDDISIVDSNKVKLEDVVDSFGNDGNF